MNWNAKVNVEYLEDQLVSDIIKRMGIGLDEAEQAHYNLINEYSARKCLDEYLKWNGIHGYTDEIIRVIDSIRESQKHEVVLH